MQFVLEVFKQGVMKMDDKLAVRPDSYENIN
jgi:hypothetical protein